SKIPESFLIKGTGLKLDAHVPITFTLDAPGAFIRKITELSDCISGEMILTAFICACNPHDKTSRQIVSFSLNIFFAFDCKQFEIFKCFSLLIYGAQIIFCQASYELFISLLP